MDPKQQVLEYLKALGASKTVTREEVLRAYDAGAGVPPLPPVPTPVQTAAPAAKRAADSSSTKSLGIAEILYYIGGGIVFVGISIFIWQNWATLSFPAKLMATLGGGVAAYIVGVLFGTQEKLEGPSNAFFLISALVMPVGLYVIFDNAGYSLTGAGIQTVIATILFLTYLSSYFVYRKAVFILFSIIFGTWVFYSGTDYLISQNASIDILKFLEYRALVSGISYILFGYAFLKNTRLTALSGALFGFGSLGILASTLVLGGWSPNQNPFWELAYPFVVFGVLYLSVYLKSKSFLTFGTIFLMIYILKLTSEYFSSGLGWPLALVIAGLLMIAVGYLAVTLNKRYIAS